MLSKIKVLMGNRCNFLHWQVNASRFHGKDEIITCCSNLGSSLCGISVYYWRPSLTYRAECFRVSAWGSSLVHHTHGGWNGWFKGRRPVQVLARSSVSLCMTSWKGSTAEKKTKTKKTCFTALIMIFGLFRCSLSLFVHLVCFVLFNKPTNVNFSLLV